MKRAWKLAVLATFALGSVACNPKGTCVIGDANHADDAQCALDFPKKACAADNLGTFFEETRAQGLLRCKGEGFDFAPGGGKDILFKKKK